MEVHHHPHAEKKNFKTYFLEFLMIFLAVTMGFIAENVREHFSERSKERQYIMSFVRNLRDDTARLRHVIRFDAGQISGIDSLLKLAHADFSGQTNLRSFYSLALKYLYNSATFKSNNATIQELKSTGDYRLIEKDHAADSLSKYDAETMGIYEEGEYYTSYFKDIMSRLDEMTDLTIIMDTSSMNNSGSPEKQLPPLRGDVNKLPAFFNKVFTFRMITNSYSANNLKPMLNKATGLLKYLKELYDLSDDSSEE